jgi:NADPH:quinone reductase-like Zn-dependent oxidoreductase
MKAFQIYEYGDNSVLKEVEIPIPVVSANQVLVKLKASAVNPIDYKIRSGYLSKQLVKPLPFTIGWEGSGIIAEANPNSLFKKGDEVILIPNFMQGGTHAEYVVIIENEIMKKPESMNFIEAATIPFSLGTAYTALVEDAGIKAGQTILIHGAGGAVGQMAVQIAKNKGLLVLGTATGEHITELINLGIDQVIDYATTDFTQVVSNLDVILDLVGGETLFKSYPLIKKGGIIISTTQPPSESDLEKYEAAGKMTQTRFELEKFEKAFQLIEQGAIQLKKPVVYPFSDTKEALSIVESRKAKSKIVLQFPE